MKVLCDREKLREGLAVVNNVIPTRSTKPILENVYLVATDEALELVGTDLEVAIRYRIDDVKVGEPGTAAVPARVSLDFIRDLGGETVHIETRESNCTITSGADRCELVTADPEEYPITARFAADDAFTVQGGAFARLVGQTAFAAAREAGRYAMHGVLTEVKEGKLKLVATDGRRLSLSETAVDAKQDTKAPAIVPTKGMQLFCRVIDDPLDMIHFQFGDNQIGMKSKNAEVFARLIDGEFPRYDAVIPSDCKNRMEADAELLSRKIRLVANVTGDDARAVRLKAEKGELELHGKSAGGEAKAVMECDFKGGPAEIAFNPDYVLEGLKNADKPIVSLQFDERTSPGKFELGENHVYIVMPITVDA